MTINTREYHAIFEIYNTNSNTRARLENHLESFILRKVSNLARTPPLTYPSSGTTVPTVLDTLKNVPIPIPGSFIASLAGPKPRPVGP